MAPTFKLSATEPMSLNCVGDLVVETLKKAGVKRIYGVVGDGLHGLTEAVRRRGTIDWVPLRHERAASYAASWEAQMTGELAACAGSFGAEDLDLIEGLRGADRSRTPVLAMAAHVSSAEARGGKSRKTHPQNLFRDCSRYCEHVPDPSQLPFALENAARAAVDLQGVAVVVISAPPGNCIHQIGGPPTAIEQTDAASAARERTFERTAGR